MTSVLPRLLGPPTIPQAELSALRLDGQLYRVGDSYATLDTPDTHELRAEAFALLAAPSMIADRRTAAWIHGVRAEPPPVLHACVDRARRGPASNPPGIDLRQCALERGDVLRVGRARLTSPLRTVVDLLRTEQRFTAGLALQVQALLALAGVAPAECQAHIKRHIQSPGTRRALVRLAAVPQHRAAPESQPALTRYTS
ncbi:hypothetical protein [Leifsonia poae]|uniref:hypothetical protein n=1 Tax=Leifsonia poae TaxID=110933 RepID=UPI0022F29A5C|nr:hypothetical protein [Leifsonia poae]